MNDSSEKPAGPQKKRTRSPAYPFLNLQEAIEKARTIWDHEKRNPVSIEVLAQHWGASATSSAPKLIASALAKFGLLEDVEGGKSRMLKLSDSALRIIHDQDDSQERRDLLKRCALSPSIHSRLWNEYNGELPSDVSLRRHLILEEMFNDTAVDGFIRQFRATISFAKLGPDDKVATGDSESDDSRAEPEINTANPPRVESQVQKAMQSPTPVTVSGSGTVTVSREFTFPLPIGMASLRVPFPLNEDDFSTLIEMLNVFKKGLVKASMPMLSSSDSNWESQAEHLARDGKEFGLAGFDFSHHSEACTRIARSGNLDFQFDPVRSLGFFKSRHTS